MKNPIFLLLLSASLFLCTGLQAQRITVTVAGTGFPGYDGDNRSARQAKLYKPNYVGTDKANNVYFSDQGGSSGLNTRIRKLASTTGRITTIAGGGTSSAEGVPATNAIISVRQLCVDPFGNIYFASTNKIQRIDAITNAITTIAGTGSPGFSGDGGPAVLALFSNISGLCLDTDGNIYIVDGGNYRIRKINAGTGTIMTIAGTGSFGYSGDGGPASLARLYSLRCICTDHTGNVYFGDQGGEKIRRINTSGIINTVIGGGGSSLFGVPGLSTMVGSMLSGLCCDSSGNVIFDEASCSCRKWSPSTDTVYPMGGNFTIESFRNDTMSNYAWMNYNYGVATDDVQNVYVGDGGNNRIRKIITLTPKPTFAFGKGQSITPCPGLSLSLDSLLWITDKDSAQVETWSVVTAPMLGSLGGFPATVLSNGIHETVKPSGLYYTFYSSLSGQDSFKIRVSDGTLSDTITIHASVFDFVESVVSGSSTVCTGASEIFTTGIPGGTWSVTNPSATVGAASGTVTGVLPGQDTIQYNIGGSCAYKVITVNPSPLTGTIIGYDSLCPSSSITLTATVSGGTWSSTNPSVANVSSTGTVLGSAIGTTVIRYTTSNPLCTAYSQKNLNVFTPSAGVISGPTSVCAGTSMTLVSPVPFGTWSTASSGASVDSSSGIVTGIVAGPAIITYTAIPIPGCGTFTTFPVAIVPFVLPAAGAITGPDHVCQASHILFGNTAIGGIWSISNTNASISSSGTVTGVALGSATIYYTLSNLCGSVSAVKNISIKPRPDPGTISGSDTVCIGKSITLVPSLEDGIWSSNNAGYAIISSGNIFGVSPGNITIWYSVSDGWCSEAAVKFITVKDCLPIEIPYLAKEPGIEIFPNPATNLLHITLAVNYPVPTSLKMTNTFGQIVLSKELSGNSQALDISALPEGLYLLSISGTDIHMTKKIAIAR